jgi:hypothetical protein
MSRDPSSCPYGPHHQPASLAEIPERDNGNVNRSARKSVWIEVLFRWVGVAHVQHTKAPEVEEKCDVCDALAACRIVSEIKDPEVDATRGHPHFALLGWHNAANSRSGVWQGDEDIRSREKRVDRLLRGDKHRAGIRPEPGGHGRGIEVIEMAVRREDEIECAVRRPRLLEWGEQRGWHSRGVLELGVMEAIDYHVLAAALQEHAHVREICDLEPWRLGCVVRRSKGECGEKNWAAHLGDCDADINDALEQGRAENFQSRVVPRRLSAPIWLE